MKAPVLTFLMLGFGLLACQYCCNAQESDAISKKTTPILFNILNSKDPVQLSKTRGIELKNNMIKVVVEVDPKLLPGDFPARYNLREYKFRKNTVSAYVAADDLKKMCDEPGVIHIRTPFKFRPLFGKL